MDRYAKTLLTKVGHIFILYQPLRERKYVSFTKAKIWVLEICPKIASHATFFMFLFISQEGDRLGKIYLTTSNQHGCRSLGQEQKYFVSCTQAKIWVLEICPKIASHATFFTFLFISQERDHLGRIYLITSNQHGCRNLGQNQLENFWLLARRQFLLQAWYALLNMFLLKQGTKVQTLER